MPKMFSNMSLISSGESKARAVPSPENVPAAARTARFYPRRRRTQCEGGKVLPVAAEIAVSGSASGTAGGVPGHASDGTRLAGYVLSCVDRQNTVGQLSYCQAPCSLGAPCSWEPPRREPPPWRPP